MSKSENRTKEPEVPDQDEIDPEQLISQVQLYDLLYNKQNKLHSRTTCTEAAWQKVAESVGSTPKTVQKKWANLRRCFRDAISKENLPSGSGAPRGRKKFPFIAQMGFLREHMSKKPNTVSNFETDPNVPDPAAGIKPGSYPGEENYTGNSWSAPFSGYESEDGTGGTQLDTSFLKALSPVVSLIPLSEAEKSDDGRTNGGSSSGSERQARKKRRLSVDSVATPDLANRDRNTKDPTEEPGVPNTNRDRRKPINADPIEEFTAPIPMNRNRRKTTTADPIEEFAARNPMNRRKKDKKRSSSESGESVRRKKLVKRKTKKTNPKTVPRNVVQSDTEEEANQMFRCITNAATSITHRSKAKSDVDGIVKGFVKMQKHMLMKLNEDSRLEYIKDATNKLTELVQREKYII